MAVVYPDPTFFIFKKTIKSDTINKIKYNGNKENYFDFCFVSKCLHISNSRYKLAGLDF